MDLELSATAKTIAEIFVPIIWEDAMITAEKILLMNFVIVYYVQ